MSRSSNRQKVVTVSVDLDAIEEQIHDLEAALDLLKARVTALEDAS